jgi:hypothetical protein
MVAIKNLKKYNLNDAQIIEFIGEDVKLLLDLSDSYDTLDSTTKNVYDSIDNEINKFISSEEGQEKLNLFLKEKGIKQDDSIGDFDIEEVQLQFDKDEDIEIDLGVESVAPIDIGLDVSNIDVEDIEFDEELDEGELDDIELDLDLEEEEEDEPIEVEQDEPIEVEEEDEEVEVEPIEVEEEDEPIEVEQDEQVEVEPIEVEVEDAQIMTNDYVGVVADIPEDFYSYDISGARIGTAFRVFFIQHYGIDPSLEKDNKLSNFMVKVTKEDGRNAILFKVNGYAPTILFDEEGILIYAFTIEQLNDFVGLMGEYFSHVLGKATPFKGFKKVDISYSIEYNLTPNDSFEIKIKTTEEKYNRYLVGKSDSIGFTPTYLTISGNVLDPEFPSRLDFDKDLDKFLTTLQEYQDTPMVLAKKIGNSVISKSFTLPKYSTPLSSCRYDLGFITGRPKTLVLNNGSLVLYNISKGVLDSGLNMQQIPYGENRTLEDMSEEFDASVLKAVNSSFDNLKENSKKATIYGDLFSTDSLALAPFGLRVFLFADDAPNYFSRAYVDLALHNYLTHNKQGSLNYRVAKDSKGQVHGLYIYNSDRLVASQPTIPLTQTIPTDRPLLYLYDSQKLNKLGCVVPSSSEPKESKTQSKTEFLKQKLASYEKALALIEKMPKGEKRTERINLTNSKIKFTKMLIERNK